MVVKITNWGAKVQQILVPDKEGVLGDVALGYDSIDQLQAGQSSMGAFIGRYANRIGQAKFTLDGQEYKLAANNGANSLHGGQKGSRFVVFDAKQIDDAAVQMSYVFKDGEEGYPGTVPLRVVYSVTDDNEFVIEYHATAVGQGDGGQFHHAHVLQSGGPGQRRRSGPRRHHQRRQLHAHRRDADPDRRNQAGQGHAHGLHQAREARRAHRAGLRAAEARHRLRPQLRAEQDVAASSASPRRVYEPTSGRVMEVWSTEPGLQLYSGNHLEGKAPRDVGKGGAIYTSRTGFCLEPQHFPDSPNKPHFPSTVLKCGRLV